MSGVRGIRDELRAARRADGVHGAYLFEGPPGTGRAETALWFARLLFCREPGDDPCGNCGDCLRSGAAGSQSEIPPAHPDLHLVEPDGAHIKVGQIRELQTRLALVANEGGHRVGLILDAQKLNLESANALLKTLEEPPSATTLILVATAGETLPPTLRSRTTRLRFRRQPESEVAAALAEDGLAEADARLVASLGGGSLTAAREWAEANLEDAREMRDALLAGEASNASAALDFAEGFRGRGAARERCDLFIAVHAAVVREAVERALRDGDRSALERWLLRAEAGERARAELSRRNLNPQLVAEGLLFALQSP